EIRRPWINVSVSWIELPGMKPQVSASYRNVENAKWTVRKIVPSEQQKDYAQHGESDLHRTAGPTVSTWQSKLTVPSPHAQSSSSFELDVKEPGAYVLEVLADGKHTAQTFALVTQQVTVLKVGKDSAVTFTTDAETGKAAPGAQATLFVYDYDGSSQHEKLTAQADETGVARFDLKKFKRPQVTAWVKSGPHWSWARANSGYYHSNNEERLGWVLTDRPLYKPGETVNFKIFLRTRSDGPSVPVKGDSFTFYVRDASGKELGKPTLTTNEFGTATFAVTLGKQAQLGTYTYYLQNNARSYQVGTNSFRVEEYKPPEYTVSVTAVGKPKPGEAAKFKVSASFFFGGPVANATGRAIVYVRSWSHQWKPWPEDLAQPDSGGYSRGRGRHRYDDDDGYYGGYYRQQLAQHTLQFKTGADGTSEVEVPATKNAEGHPGITWDIQVFVTDASRREVTGTGSVNASAQPYFVDVRTDRFLYKPGEKVQLKFRSEDANGRPEGPQLVARLVRVTDTGVGAAIAEKKLKLEGGAGTTALDADALGPVRVEVRAADAAADSPVLATAELWLTNDAKPMVPPNAGFQLFTDRGPLRSGQMLRVLLVTPSTGGHALLSLESEKIHLAKGIELNGRARFIELPLTVDMAPNCWLHVSRVEHLNNFQTHVPIRVLGAANELDVKVKFASEQTEPGTTQQATVTLAGNAPKGAPFETAITFVDEALFALEPENTGFVDYFGRKPRQLSVQTASTLNQRSYRPRAVKQQAKPIVQAPDSDKNEEPSKKLKAADSLDDLGRTGAGMGAAPSESRAMAPAPAAAAAERKSAKKESAGAERDEEAAGPGGNKAGGFDAPVKVRTDFGTSAGWFAAVLGKVGAPIQATARLTDSLTTWRAIATVVTDGSHLGVGRATIRTERPLMVRLQAPRFFTEKDEVTLSAIVTSRLPATAEIDVAIGAPGLKPLGVPRKLLKV
ncbi:MAG: hypothetical protein H6Q89_5196, partial [Myxococcaceae bacterium]|nr:hypothetical protein [Myxococcaceae bacterium]